MTKTNPYAYDPARSQRTLVRNTLLELAMPRQGEPTLAWELAADGLHLTGRGPRDAVALAAGRVGDGNLRDQVNRGAKRVNCKVGGFGGDATVTLTVTN